MFVFVFVCAFNISQSMIHKRSIENQIYPAIDVIVKEKYKNDPVMAECLMKHFRENKIAEEFYTPNLLIDQVELTKKIEPYYEKAKECSVADGSDPDSSSSNWIYYLIGGIAVIIAVGVGIIAYLRSKR